MRCCLIQNLVTGVIPSEPVVPPIYRLYYTTVAYTDTVGGRLNAGSFGSVVTAGGADDYLAFASWLQANVISESGVFQNNVGFQYSFWVISEAEPVGWEWAENVVTPVFNPVVWVDAGIVTDGCFQERIFLDTATYYLLSADAMPTIGNPVTFITYDDIAFPTDFAINCRAWFGNNASGIATVTPGVSVIVDIQHTYLPAITITSTNFTINQSDIIPPAVCP